MQRNKTVGAFCWLAFLCAVVQEQSLAAQQIQLVDQNDYFSWSKSVVEKTDYDFGDVKIGSDVKPVIRLSNKTDKRFLIESVSSSCGCMKTSLNKTEIRPGETGNLTITFDTKRFMGARSASIHVLFAEPKGREVKLSARVNIRNLVCEPEEIVFSGQATDAVPLSRQISLKRRGSPFWKVKSITSSSGFLTAKLNECKINGSVVNYSIEAILKPDPANNTNAIQNEKLILETNDSSQPTFEIPVIIRNRGSIEVSPKVLSFSTTAIGEKKVAIVRFKDAQELAFMVRPEGSFQIEKIAKLNAKTYKLEIVQKSEEASDAELFVELADSSESVTVKLTPNKPGLRSDQ